MSETTQTETSTDAVPTYQNYDLQGYYTFSTEVDYHGEDPTLVMPPPWSATLVPIPHSVQALTNSNKWLKFDHEAWVLVDNYVGVVYWLSLIHI
jgi:hypothetical protein